MRAAPEFRLVFIFALRFLGDFREVGARSEHTFDSARVAARLVQRALADAVLR